MKAQFFLGMGLGAAAAAGVSMLMNAKQPGVQKAMDAAKQTVDQAKQKIIG